MTDVIIAADDRDKKLWETLPKILSEHLAAEIVICGPEDAKKKKSGRAIVICGGEKPALEGIFPLSCAVAVVDSMSAAALGQIGGSGLPAITCGLSARDTLTLTSFGLDSAVLAVQRSIACFDGSLVEPQEIPFRLGGGIDSFVLMAAASVFLLTGNAGWLKNATI